MCVCMRCCLRPDNVIKLFWAWTRSNLSTAFCLIYVFFRCAQNSSENGAGQGRRRRRHCTASGTQTSMGGINKINCELRFHIPICCCCILCGCEKGDYENKVDAEHGRSRPSNNRWSWVNPPSRSLPPSPLWPALPSRHGHQQWHKKNANKYNGAQWQKR